MSGIAFDRRAPVIRGVALVALLVAVAWMLRATPLHVLGNPLALATRLRAVPAAPVIFVGLYAMAATLALPATPLTLAGGIVFGFGEGAVLNWAAATVGATGSYFLSRALGADAIRRVLGRHAERVEALSRQTGWMGIGRLRLIPLIPFDGLSVAAGVARVPARAFIVGTAFGMIPGTLVYTWFAQSLAAGVAGASRTAWTQLAVASVLLLALSFVPVVVRRRRSART
ncbi:MAG: TVP38/TMEM64 family protein [Gemmatimonadota bacterium]|nr:TVP38/TMEM64 family protein [Gemmatimonadota bacterium]